MTEILLLPQWAESLQEDRRRQWQVFKEGLLSIVTSIRTAVTTVINAVASAVQPILDAVERAMNALQPKPRQRSSRRLRVQQKRKALGLSVEGKLPPEWAKGMRYSRKESLQVAIIVKTFDLPWLKVGVLS